MEAPVTKSECFTAQLCDRSFLRLWSYPRVFRDQGKRIAREGKEVCDLLVVCGNDVIIFSVKECEYKNTGRPSIDWARWYDRAIHRSVKQVLGAERWIFEFRDRLFLDRACKCPLPIEVPPKEKASVHRVLVSLGGHEACAAAFGDRSGMRIWPDLKGDEHVAPVNEGRTAFALGDVAPGHGWIHILDEKSLELVLSELDTITDFTWYLQKKESFIKSRELAYAVSEADLLSVYLTQLNENEEHDFPRMARPNERIVVASRSWSDLQQSDGYAMKHLANRQSYLWDSIINKFALNAQQGTLVDSALELGDVERMIREMAREDRVSRRMLSQALYGLVSSSPANHIARRFVLSHRRRELGYMFVSFPEQSKYKNHRQLRRQYLADCCMVLAHRNRSLKMVIGLATEAGIEAAGRSEDLVLFRSPDLWPADLEADAEKVSTDFGILNPETLKLKHYHEDEYRTGSIRPRPDVEAWRAELLRSMTRRDEEQGREPNQELT